MTALILSLIVIGFVTFLFGAAVLQGLLYRVSFWAAGINTKDITEVIKHLKK